MKRFIILFLIFISVALRPHLNADMACVDYLPTIDNGSMGDLHAATSILSPKDEERRYFPERAFDGDMKTAWAEGKDGDGIGEKLGFCIGTTVKKVRIVPGLAHPAYFKKNNRVKKARLTFHKIKGQHAHQCGLLVEFGGAVKTVTLSFRDAMTWQEFDVGLREESENGHVGILTILEVYPGEKWRDTCISEVAVVPFAEPGT